VGDDEDGLALVAANQALQGGMHPRAYGGHVLAAGWAVLGAYLIWFPKAKVRVVIPIVFLFLIPFQVPAVLMIGLWFLQNLLAGYATINAAATADAGVAWFAHIGGFLFGAAIALTLRRPPKRARRPFQG